MDPLTTLSLAGTVVQFVDFGTRLFTESYGLFKSTGESLAAHEEREFITRDLIVLISKLNHLAFDSTSGNVDISQTVVELQSPLESLCDRAKTIAEEILNKLNELKIPREIVSKGSKLKRAAKSLQVVIRSSWSRTELDDLLERLGELRKSIDTNVLFDLRESINAQAIQNSARFDQVGQQTQQLFISLLENHGKTSQNIITTLARITSRLELLNKDIHHQAEDPLVSEIGIRKNLKTNRVHMITAGIEMLAVSPIKERILREHVAAMIVKSLYYPMMTSRYENIEEAFPATLEWAFSDSTDEQLPWTNFAEWLKNGEGIYWINGKAASGKSTLMKHAFDDQRTRQYLQEWSGTTDSSNNLLVIATFFFWNSGSPEQRSHTGLLRALLHQLIVHNPFLAPIAFPTVWADLYSDFLNDVRRKKLSSKSWSLRDLKEAFMRVIRQTHLPQKIFLMIDGLDEFDGDHEYLVDLFREVTIPKPSTCRVKVCLSSRPWVIFEDSFRSCASLKLQNLTFRDIEIFVDQKLRANSSFKALAEDEPEASQKIIFEIVERANGVFLWVRLVVKSLLSGLRNLDDISDLWRRLVLLPKELQPLYKHLLGLIEPVYVEWVSKVFRIVRISYEPFQEAVPSTGMSARDRGLFLAVLFLSMDESLGIEDVQNLSLSYLLDQCRRTTVHLTARCAGLLEVPICADQPEQTPTSVITFLHRTAYDFIRGEQQWALIMAPTIHSSFNPSFAMARASSLWVFWNRRFPSTEDWYYICGYYIPMCVMNAMTYVGQAVKEGMPFSRLLEFIEEFPVAIGTSRSMPRGPRFLSVLDLAALFGLKKYVLEKIPRLDLTELNSLLQLLQCLDPKPRDERYSPSEVISAIVARGGMLTGSKRHGEIAESVSFEAPTDVFEFEYFGYFDRAAAREDDFR